MHHWSGNFRYFRHVGEAAFEIGEFCRRWGRINVSQTKEKFGEARVYCGFGWDSFHSITHPGHMYIRYPDWLAKINSLCWTRPGRFIFRLINRVIVPYHKFIYSLAYNRAFKKYFYITDEIYYGADSTRDIKLTKYSTKLFLRRSNKDLRKAYTKINKLTKENEMLKFPEKFHKELQEP